LWKYCNAMTLEKAHNEFIGAWGSLGSSWGVNRTMAQIHALLLVSVEPLSAEDIMEKLNISRGNVNMNVRTLLDWGLAEKRFITGERKEFFIAGKEVWNLAKQVARERKKRELEPLQRTLNKLKLDSVNTAEEKEFQTLVNDLSQFADSADGLLSKFINSKKNWIFKLASKL